MARRQVWDYQPEEGETEAPWLAFVAFRDGPKPRNLGKLAVSLDYSVRTLEAWSGDFCWFDRAAAWDRHQDQKAQRLRETAVQRMTRKHLDLAGTLRQIAAREARRLLKDHQANLIVLTPRDLIRMAEMATKLERLGHGEATERVETIGEPLSKLTDEQFRQVEAAAALLRGEKS